MRLAADLPATVGAADRRLRRLLTRIDRHVEAAGLRGEVGEPAPVRAVALPAAVEELDLRAAGVRSIVWATGYRRAYPWLRVPVLDAHGEIRQRRGLTPVPGLYVLGQRFQHRRSSNFIGGVGRDAAFVAGHIAVPPQRLEPTRAHCREPTSYDAVIVGARVAGAATAMLLARFGLRVLLVDRGRPAPTPCPPTR